MGGLLHFLDFKHSGKSRKIMKHKRRDHGTEAPRNSMELPSHTSFDHQRIHDNIPLSVQEEHHSKLNLSPSGIPLKKSSDQEITKQVKFSQNNAPSVVARLMGMDALPSETKSSANSKGKVNGTLRNELPTKMYSGQCQTVASTPTKLRRDEPPASGDTNSTTSNQGSKTIRLKPREHPQEEILQKFKKEFEAWQAKKSWEQTNIAGLKINPQSVREKSSTQQGAFKKEKMVKHEHAGRKTSGYNSTNILIEQIRGTGSQNEEPKCNPCQSNPAETMSLQSQTRPVNSEYSTKPAEKNESPTSPTRIVVLKPGDENIGDTDDICSRSSACASQKELSMEDFLEEVRSRLRMEINGKTKSTTSGSVAGACSTERLPHPRQAAQGIARQIRESVASDLCTKLAQSESSRSDESVTQHVESVSPESISGDKRRHLKERLNDTLRNKEDGLTCSSRVTSSGTRSPSNDVNRSRLFADTKRTEEMVVCREDNHSLASKTRFFREGEANGTELSAKVSPRNFDKSLPALVPGSASGKLLSEEKHVLTGACIQGKDEVTDNYSIRSKKNKKNHFGFKGRVSNLKHNVIFKGLGRKVHLVEKTDAKETDCITSNETVSTCAMNTEIIQTRLENLTEIPPTPASVSSSSIDDLCKPGHPSPVSPLDVPFTTENRSPQISNDVRCDVPQTSDEIRCVIPRTSYEISREFPQTFEEVSCASLPASGERNGHEIHMSQGVKADAKIHKDEIIDVDNHEEAYVRDILITAGLHERESAQDAILRWGTSQKILPKWVFEEVEEAFRDKRKKRYSNATIMSYEVACVDHMMLFDLVDEALEFIVQPLVINSLSKKSCLVITETLHGKLLFEDVLSKIKELTHLPDGEEDCSLESMAAYDVKMAPWISMSHEDSGGLETEVGLLILDDLVGEFVLDMYLD